jgi:hypothetical protein
MLISSTDLSFTQAALANEETMVIAESKSTVFTISSYLELGNISTMKHGDLVIDTNGNNIQRYEDYPDEIASWKPLVDKISGLSNHLGSMATGYIQNGGFKTTRPSIPLEQNQISTFVSNGQFQSAEIFKSTPEQLGEAVKITSIFKDIIKVGDVKAGTGLMDLYTGSLLSEPSKNAEIEEGFIFTKNAFQSILKAGLDFKFSSNKKFIFEAPIIDFSTSRINQIKNQAGNNVYYNGTGEINLAGATDTNPINSTGGTSLISSGMKIKTGGDSMYLGVHATLGAVRIVDTNGYNGGAFVYRPITSSAFQVGSSETYKKDIEDYTENALAIVKKNKIYRYNYKDENERKDGDLIVKKGKTKGNKIGVIAEESPEILGEDNLSVDIYKMVSVSWKALQELNDKVFELEGIVKKLSK